MTEYEVFVETMNPCGGAQHAKKEFIEIEAESPEAYVKAHGQYPVREISKTVAGDVVITTGNEAGYIIRYTFTE